MLPDMLPDPSVHSAPASTRALVAVSLLLLAAGPFIPESHRRPGYAVLLALLVLSLATAMALRAWDAAHVALIAALYIGAYILPIVGELWPLPLLVILAGYGVALACVPALRRSVRFWTRGAVDRTTAAWMVAFSVAAAIALIAWRYGAAVDMSSYRRFVPASVPVWAVFAGLVPYAMLNAVFEELVWRGVLWQGSATAFGARGALLLTSLSFGLAHYRGFPSGALGVALASIYGLMMGLVRMRSGGLLAPWIAHVLADVVIFTMVVAMVVAS